MAHPCIVKFCRNIGSHRFPQDDVRKLQWIEAIKHINPGMSIRKSSRICAAHFLHTDFQPSLLHLPNSGPTRKVLKNTAVPSVFPWTQTRQETNDEADIGTYPKFDPSALLHTYERPAPTLFVETAYLQSSTSPPHTAEDPLQLPQDFQSQETEADSDLVQNLQQPAHYFEDNANYTEIEIGSKSIGIQVTLPQQQDEIPKSIGIQVALPQQQDEIPNQTQNQDSFKTHGFSIYAYNDDDKAIHFYTGLESFKKFIFVFYSLGRFSYDLKYFYGPPPEKIDTLEQFFITLIILRRHKTFEEMTMLYKITLKHVYSIFITWIRFMALQWKGLDLWITKENVKAYMPSDFFEKYPETRVILDATECPVKKPKLPLAQQITFSTYKNKNTIKVIVGITPGGMISYVSPAYGGSATDRNIIERSTILKMFDYNDEIMVDKGLNVQDIFLPYGVKVNMPAFFRKGNQIASETLSSNRKVASKRVHIERVIGMLKTYKILSEPMNQTEILLSSDIVYVIAMLVNFRNNIVNKNA